jgi:hypothetical protein
MNIASPDETLPETGTAESSRDFTLFVSKLDAGVGLGALNE